MTTNLKNSNKKIKPKIIAICGYKRSGKDTIAKYLEKKHYYKHLKITYKLKECIKLLFNLNNNDLEEKKEEINNKWNVSPRHMMQFIGTEMFQYKIQELLPNIDKKFWIQTFLNDNLVNKLRNNDKFNIVISDLRFIHEYEELIKLNLPIIFIKVVNENIMIDDNNSLHISEKNFLEIPISYEINNNSDLNSLYNQIDNIIKLYI
tara:strand:- start:851 stop:1465 length:615 start_codon:yes stop_codon:yes gene_type:complete